MAWWTAWGAFVGLFLARISRGRTIRSVVMYSFLAPLMYSFLWFCTFGGIGLRQARVADELIKLGGDLFANSTHYAHEFKEVGGEMKAYCYDVPQEDVLNETSGDLLFSTDLPGITPVCVVESSQEAWFNVMYSFTYPSDDPSWKGYGGFMAGLSIVALTIYFVTSSDSGSLIVDHLASNGHEDHHWLQRIFWAFTEGAVATALLLAGGKSALGALQAASLVFGLPFNFFLFAMMYGTVGMCQVAEAQEKAGNHAGKLPRPEETGFKMHLFGGIANIVEYIVSFGNPHEERVAAGIHKPDSLHIQEFFIGLFLPFYSVFRILNKLEFNVVATYSLTASYFGCFVMWIVFAAMSVENFGYVAFSFTCFFINACILIYIRANVRFHFKLDGNVIGDLIAGSFFYMQGLCQMIYEFDRNAVDTAEAGEVEGLVDEKNDDDKNEEELLEA